MTWASSNQHSPFHPANGRVPGRELLVVPHPEDTHPAGQKFNEFASLSILPAGARGSGRTARPSQILACTGLFRRETGGRTPLWPLLARAGRRRVRSQGFQIFNQVVLFLFR